jgi:hypothetical protein
MYVYTYVCMYNTYVRIYVCMYNTYIRIYVRMYNTYVLHADIKLRCEYMARTEWVD